jgi:hypothetical protein
MTVIVCAFGASFATAATASGIGLVDCTKDPTDPSCVVTVGSPGTGGSGGSVVVTCKLTNGEPVPCYVPGKGWLVSDSLHGDLGCWFQVATGADLTAAETLGGKPTPPAAWYVGTCGDPNTDWWPGITSFQEFGSPPLTALLVQQAIQRLDLPRPTIRLNPQPPAAQVVYLPTWLWLGGGWSSLDATASIPGLSVTATAKPVIAVWSTGDGSTVTCRNGGTEWTPAVDPSKASPTCGHTYTVSSARQPGGVYTVRVTVTWHVTWAGTGGIAGDAGDLTTTATRTVEVDEAVGLNTTS